MPIGSGKVNGQQFTTVTDHQMQFETKTPTGRAFTAVSNPFEDFVLLDAPIYHERRIHKTNPTTSSKTTEQKQAQPGVDCGCIHYGLTLPVIATIPLMKF